MTILEQIILLCCGSKERLKAYIDQNTDLATYCKEKYFYLFGLVIKISSSRPELIEEAKVINHERILNLLKEHRPELYVVITTYPKGLEWFNNQNFSNFIKLIP